ncbi:CHAT domain-containing protein [Tamlana crocina]|uniref:CHAT domain-containing protein n=1 Tax=Tamlana crocina TaxID=393006 RepID=A0ABX1D947_9FLAO|nr:CHAT domain-containing tetratricopeptide repeat protein [Tamlana crocina]NJX14517.1 CHAT domain-containing protein [Tamlana crocina]
MGRIFPFCKSIFFLAIFVGTLKTHTQNDSISGIKYIQNLIKNDSLAKAKKELESQLDVYRAEKNTDSLIKYIFLVGSLKLANNQHEVAIKNAEAFGEELKAYNSPYVNKEFLLELSWIYDDAGLTQKAYKTVEEAFAIAQNIKDPKKASLSTIYHSLGYLASNLGDYVLAKNQYAKSIKIMLHSKSKDYLSLHKTYNALGGMMWYSAKLDSSLYYFNRATKMLDSLEQTPDNKYYRKALVQMNIAVISHALGHIEEAIESSKKVINNYQQYLNISNDESGKLRALKHQLAAIDNLGSFYHSIGEFERADQLISYSYQKKLKNLAHDDNNLTISLIISAQSKIGLRDFNAANKLIDQAIERIKNSKNTMFFWKANALSTKASISHELGDNESAKQFYDEAYTLYKTSLGKNDYTRDFLDEIINMSQFYADTNNANKAIPLAEESYRFIKSSDFKNSIQEFHHIVNLSEVHFKLGQYQKAATYSNQAITFLDKPYFRTSGFKDSVHIQYRKPKALLINAKSKYFLNNAPTETDLKALLKEINSGIAILEQRKSIIKSYDDLSLLISENNELFDFSKQLLLGLFNLTKNENYLNRLLTIHESSLYNRIRARLNLKNDLAFANLPNSILEREKHLRNTLSSSIENNDGSFKRFFQANANWNTFLDSLKQNHPKYYKMRYASIEKPLDNLNQDISNNTTVIRYFYIEKKLYALVLTRSAKKLFPLDDTKIAEDITQLSENELDFEKTSQKLHQLHSKLWQPFEASISTENVVIIPDGILFNLSFESLTPTPVTSLDELTNNCLLKKYIISYNYSLLLLGKNKITVDYQNDFVAFAPEFTEDMKKQYSIGITDSVSVDKTYLTLLPQPFSVDLAKEYSRLFNGTSFINENASKQVFKNEANEHKIIHIGTHAESNNITPELSRLIFAKNNTDEDNSLYTYEIYNENLNSNLAILTACETGKPTYQAGEGMISLAHAFNYAGSESILTSLWKIDEKTSTEIIELFYRNIKKGMAKDKALQQAKLKYLTTAHGRTKAPNYWAGLVLIGDASPIHFTPYLNVLYWVLGGAILLIVALLLLKRLRRKALSA